MQLCCDAACRWSHEFRADRIGNRLSQDAINLRLAGRIEPPPAHLVYRLELSRVARPPQRRADSLIQHPTDRELDDSLAEALLRQAIKRVHGGEILREAGLLKFRVRAAQIVAWEYGIRP